MPEVRMASQGREVVFETKFDFDDKQGGNTWYARPVAVVEHGRRFRLVSSSGGEWGWTWSRKESGEAAAKRAAAGLGLMQFMPHKEGEEECRIAKFGQRRPLF